VGFTPWLHEAYGIQNSLWAKPEIRLTSRAPKYDVTFPRISPFKNTYFDT
jgi:hypothetical protein